jgi:hypothetical protein
LITTAATAELVCPELCLDDILAKKFIKQKWFEKIFQAQSVLWHFTLSQPQQQQQQNWCAVTKWVWRECQGVWHYIQVD